MYYVELGTKAGRDQFKAMLKTMAPAIKATVVDAISVLTEEDLFTSKPNQLLDEIATVIDL